MCIIFVGFNVREDYPLILAANRDEFYDRPTSAADFWEDDPDVFAGRDLVGGGTWLGVTKGGRFAAVTNYRDPKGETGTVSRGSLVADFLRGDGPAGEYLKGLSSRADEFSGFNLIAGEVNAVRREIFYYSNRGGEPVQLKPGVYGLSNHLLDTGWPKVSRGKLKFDAILREKVLNREAIFSVLADESLADDNALPDTGVGYEIEKALSAVFIKTPGYGTRCSTLLTFDRNFRFDLDERVFV